MKRKKIVYVQTDENIKTQINKNVKNVFKIFTTNTQTDESGLSSLFSILPSAADVNPMDEQQPLKPKKRRNGDQD